MSATIETIVSFTGCTRETAEETLLKCNGDAIQTMHELMHVPAVSGTKYIPKPRDIDRGMTPEQAEICANGRALMDKLTAVASAAHSKIRNGQSLAAGAVEEVVQVPASTEAESK